MSKVTTLNEFILEGQAAHSFATGELTRLLNDIAVASKIVSRDVRRAGLVDHILGAQGNTNVQGEEQQKLDVVADEPRRNIKTPNCRKQPKYQCLFLKHQQQHIVL